MRSGLRIASVMKTPAAQPTTSYGAICSAIALVDGKAPRRVLIFPLGDHAPRNGKPKRLAIASEADARAIATASMAYWGGADMVFDYDHQSILAPSVAGQSKAAGWIKGLSADAQGVWADPVEWTAAAAAAIEAKEYRYISPAVRHSADGRVTQIVNAGLTNTPALDVPALSSALNQEENQMDLKAIASALGLKDDADEAAVMAAIAATKAGADALTATASALGVELKDGVELTAVASAATALKESAAKAEPDPAKFVPVADVAKLSEQVATMSAQLAETAKAERAALIDKASTEGRLPPALKGHAESITGKVALMSFLAALPASGLGTATMTAAKPEKGAALTAEEIATCAAIGVSPDDFKKTRDEEMA
jgi:phage I-like protein